MLPFNTVTNSCLERINVLIWANMSKNHPSAWGTYRIRITDLKGTSLNFNHRWFSCFRTDTRFLLTCLQRCITWRVCVPLTYAQMHACFHLVSTCSRCVLIGKTSIKHTRVSLYITVQLHAAWCAFSDTLRWSQVVAQQRCQQGELWPGCLLVVT